MAHFLALGPLHWHWCPLKQASRQGIGPPPTVRRRNAARLLLLPLRLLLLLLLLPLLLLLGHGIGAGKLANSSSNP